jgi:hypothetical protein
MNSVRPFIFAMDLFERLQSSSLSMSDQFLASVACLYSFLSPDQQKALANPDQFAAFASTFSSAKAVEALVHQSIGFCQTLDFGDIMKQKSANALASVESTRWRFVVDGPPHSGRSTILGLLAKEAIHKLSASSRLSHNFVFAVNWESAVQRLTNLLSLYEFIATQVVSQLTWQCPRILPVQSSLLNWFLGIPASASLSVLPLTITNMPLFPLAAVEVLGKRVLQALKNEDNPDEFADAIAMFPSGLAACFGFETSLYVYDHLDLLDQKIGGTNAVLTGIVRYFGGNFFLISTKLQRFAATRLTGIDFEAVHTEGFLDRQLTEGTRIVSCWKPSFSIQIDACGGCPAFVHQFLAIVKCLEEIEQEGASASKKRGFVPVFGYVKQKIGRGLILELIKDLSGFGVEGFDARFIRTVETSENLDIGLKKKGRT